jgi:hypothetical protein
MVPLVIAVMVPVAVPVFVMIAPAIVAALVLVGFVKPEGGGRLLGDEFRALLVVVRGRGTRQQQGQRCGREDLLEHGRLLRNLRGASVVAAS